MVGGDDEQRSTNCSTHTSVSKLKHDSTKRRHHTKSATRSDGRGQRARATPLIPGKARATAELEGEERGKEGESHPGKFGLDFGKLNSILRGYGEYPSKYRSVNNVSYRIVFMTNTCRCTIVIIFLCHHNFFLMTGVSFGVAFCVSQRTTRPTAASWRGGPTQPTFTYTSSTQSRAGSCSGCCRGEEGGGIFTCFYTITSQFGNHAVTGECLSSSLLSLEVMLI